VKLSYHEKAFFGGDGFHSVYSRRFLPLVVLRHTPHCQQSCCFRLQEQFLQLVHLSVIATLTGSIDALLDAVHVLL
jgi:hypothetical protein